MMVLANGPNTVEFYDQDAQALAHRYDAVAFEAVHADLVRFLPPAGANVLDIGAGSGRDARAMAARGLCVTAVEPSPAFRTLASDNDGIQWIDDRLPELALLRTDDRSYEFILCSAVLMLLPASQLSASFTALAALLDVDGKLAISLRDPVVGEPAHLVHVHADDAILKAATGAGLAVVVQGIAPDALGRTTHRWRTFVFAVPRHPSR